MTSVGANTPGAGPLWRCEPVLAQARELLDDAMGQSQPADRFRIAHLAALRSTAALLSAYSTPGQRLARRPTSAWVLLSNVVAPLSAWAAYFAAGAPARAAADAGVSTAVSSREADELLDAVSVYVELCSSVVAQLSAGVSDVDFESVAAPPVRHVLVSARAS